MKAHNFPVGLFSLLLASLVTYLTIFCPPGATPANGQQLKASVHIFLDRLPLVKRDKLENLQEAIADYINGYEWMEEGREVACTILMYLEDESTAFEDRYGARMHVSNNADIQYLDKECHFEYQPGEPLVHDDFGFDSLTGLLDFYLYLLIGGELDKLEPFGGEPYLKKAKEVCRRAGFGRSEFFEGWERRSRIVDDILDKANRPFRKMKAVYFRGLMLGSSGDRPAAKSHLLKAINGLERIVKNDPQNERVKKFFKYHYLELAKFFASGEDGETCKRLIRLDPEHKGIYEKYLK